MDVSVIMINYNTFDLTKDALESIFAHTQGLTYEIILVDNLSPDGSGEKLRDLFGEKIVYLQSGGNLGTSKAFNLGLKYATGKYVLWLNTDILIKENFIKKLFDYMESDPNCGICGGNVLDFEGKPAHSFDRKLFSGRSVKRESSLVHLVFRTLFKKSLSYHYNYTGKPMEVGGIIGADMMIRTSLFGNVGQFDENIFMYGEETEFTYRVVHQTEYTVMSVPNALIYHLEGGSTVTKKIFKESKELIILKGEMTYLKKYYGRKDVLLFVQGLIKEARNKRFICALLRKKIMKEYYQNKFVFLTNVKNSFDSLYNSLKYGEE